MQRIRFLSGQHAGATLDLEPGTHTLGPDHDCDITITDWTFSTLRLDVGDAGEVCARWPNPAAGEDHAQVLADFEPCAFGDIVLCVGPADRPWPSDVQLLEAAFPPTAQRVAVWAGARLRSRATTVLSGLSVLTLVALCAVGLVGTPRAAPPPESLSSVLARAREAVARAGAPMLAVQAERSGVVVTGMVETPQQAGAVRAAVDELKTSVPVACRLAVASEVAESLRTSAGIADADVRHLGDGVFSLRASAADPKAARLAIDRVAADLRPYIRRLDVELESSVSSRAAVPILSSMQDDDLSVVQTRDGQKHLVIGQAGPRDKPANGAMR